MSSTRVEVETDRQIEEFFLKPCPVNDLPEPLKTSRRRPILHLIRRDLERVYHGEEILWPIQESKHGPPFLVCLGIMSGLDLLVRFFVSDTDRKGHKIGNGERFTRFLARIGRIRKTDAEFFWAFRNALSHSYGIMLDAPKFAGVGVTLSTGSREASWLTKRTIQRKGKRIREFIVNMWELKKLFLDVIERCRIVVAQKKNRAIRNRFGSRYASHGSIVVNPEVKKPGVPLQA